MMLHHKGAATSASGMIPNQPKGCFKPRRTALWSGGAVLTVITTIAATPAYANPINTPVTPDLSGQIERTIAEQSNPTNVAVTIGQVGEIAQDVVNLERVLDVLEQAGSDFDGTKYGPNVSTVALQLSLLLSHYLSTADGMGDEFTNISYDFSQWLSPAAGDVEEADAEAEVIIEAEVEADAVAEAEASEGATEGDSAEFDAANLVDEAAVDLITEVTVNGRTIDLEAATWDDVSQVATYLASLMSPDNFNGVEVSVILPDLQLEGDTFEYATTAELIASLVNKYGRTTDGYANGYLPKEVLCALPFAQGHWSRCDAAGALIALNEQFRMEFGYDLPITSSYRTFESQVQLAISKPRLAASPGYSMHGWGLAIDFGGAISGGTSLEYEWMVANAPTFGWQNPNWARPTGSKPEPWHFEFMSASKPAGLVRVPQTTAATATSAFEEEWDFVAPVVPAPIPVPTPVVTPPASHPDNANQGANPQNPAKPPASGPEVGPDAPVPTPAPEPGEPEVPDNSTNGAAPVDPAPVDPAPVDPTPVQPTPEPEVTPEPELSEEQRICESLPEEMKQQAYDYGIERWDYAGIVRYLRDLGLI